MVELERRELKLFGKREIKPDVAYESYKKLKFDDTYFSCVEVEFKLRTAPQVARQGQATHYAHLGVIDIIFRAYSLTGEDISDIEKWEVFEDMDIVEHLTESSLKDLQADIDHYLKGDKEKEDKKVKKKSSIPNPFKGLKELFSPLGSLIETKKATSYQKGLVIGEVKSDAMANCQILYSVFKKSHRMVTW